MRRFLIDNQLPASLARWLEARSCQASHVLSVGLERATDEQIWRHAASAGAVILTKDEDFAHFSLVRAEAVAVVWLRVGNCRRDALIATMDRAWPGICEQLDSGARLIEVQ